MSCQFFFERGARFVAMLGLLLAPVVPASAAPQAILPFVTETWSELGHSSMRPMIVVFTTTDCVHCPGVIDSLAASIRASRSVVRLVVVVMDGAVQQEALREDRHYRQANVLYVFDGDAMALRFKVNPDWRGLTPYVVLIPAAGAVGFHAGAPSALALRTFLRP